MIVVADAGPLRYLVLIECVEVLGRLYNQAVVPMAVAHELRQASTPVAVRNRMAQLPNRCEVHADPLPIAGLGLRPGRTCGNPACIINTCRPHING